MGQAQLLLIVLGVVLVGIAIIAGIQAYDQNNRKASVDALTHDAMRMASDLQTWAQKPSQFGGPLIHGNFTQATDDGAANRDVTLNDLGYTQEEQTINDVTIDGAHNSNGACVLGDIAATSATITCQNPSLGTLVEVTVSGLSDDDIALTERQLEATTG